MSGRKVTITPDIVRDQRRAGASDTSVWVEANAGSGKTHVLTERVARLLLNGASPQNLLCLTYTKAAAAEMRRRIGERLARWAIMQDEELAAALTALEDRPQSPEDLRRARTLFGHALETPGGLKINTIHAFCESVLQRFPLEAGVPFGFSVVQDNEQAEMIARARDTVLAQGVAGEGPAPDAVLALYGMLSDTQIAAAIDAALARRTELELVLATPRQAKANLRALLRLEQDDTISALKHRMTAHTLLGDGLGAQIVAAFDGDPKKTKRMVDILASIDFKDIDPDILCKAFLTANGAPRQKLSNAEQRAARPDLVEICEQEQKRLHDLHTRLHAARLAARSDAFIDVLGAIMARYERSKRAAARLDFDDLISGMRRLLTSSQARDWVRYKLDAGITHILLDESQDTNPVQWDLIWALAEEFLAGDSAVQRPRTLFAVGDKKQSIYSFQGAVPEMFSERGREFGLRARQVDHPFRPVELATSFRTLPNILDAVDRVCATDPVKSALLIDERYRTHNSARTDRGGRVVMWPPIRQQEVAFDEGEWPVYADKTALAPAPRQVAEHIVATIAEWIRTARPIEQRGQPVTADDILILVQSRGQVFHEVIRALKRAQLPTPGADKLPVSTHIAVLDLLALADVLLNTADDLNLAAVLRSPLFAVSEDDLLALASGREDAQSLWSALKTTQIPSCSAAYARLRSWRTRLDRARPYDFFADILYAQGGLRHFHARLGEEVDDVLAEFLNLALEHEQSTQPSLQGFLAAMRRSDIEIKRELGEAGSGVRVMTVHGAKGLEAPIVILADATRTPSPQKMGSPIYVETRKPGPLLIHAQREDTHTQNTTPWRNRHVDNQRAEYWRQLYVAMTRAEDELYVTGALTKGQKTEGSWYDIIETALADDAIRFPIEGRESEGLVYPTQLETPAELSSDAAQKPDMRSPIEVTPLPVPQTPQIIQPSLVGATNDKTYQTDVGTIDPAQARREGVALHALLQHLSGIDLQARDAVAARALEALLPDDAHRHQTLAEKALNILHNPDNERMFGPDSRAEVPFVIAGMRRGKPVRITGRIDRLIIADDSVCAIDFKSDAMPPVSADDVPSAYLTQLGLYRRAMENLFAARQVSAAIFWTAHEELMILPNDALDEATADFTFERSA